jgi:hypothetical protein
MAYTSEEQAAYRAGHPEYVRRSALQSRARNKALATLKERHKREFDTIYAACCKELGLELRWTR